MRKRTKEELWEKLQGLDPGEYWVSWTDEDRTDTDKYEKHIEQRMSFGYSVYDWWSFDSYIAGVIAHAVDKFVKDGVGHPGNMTEAQWQEICNRVSFPLKLWSSSERWKLETDELEALYEKVQESLHLFADNFGDFWD